jgi:hypothetical protein
LLRRAALDGEGREDLQPSPLRVGHGLQVQRPCRRGCARPPLHPSSSVQPFAV